MKKTGSNVKCPCCNGDFYLQESARRGGRKYCSRKCYLASLVRPIGEKAHHWRGGKQICIDCGKRASYQSRARCGSCSRKYRVGNNHPRWEGGITPINKKIRNSIEYKLWREAVFERDDYTCVFCGDRSRIGKRVKLQADHIKPFSLFPELRFAIDNGRTLCVECHRKTLTFAGNIVKYRSKNETK